MLQADWDDPAVSEFVDNIGRVNAIAERFPGFIWRLRDDEMEAEQIGAASPIDWVDNARVASTLSVWESGKALSLFVYQGVHGDFYRQGSRWLSGQEGWPRLVLWLIKPGTRPTVAQAVARLKYLRENGASAHAFDFASMRLYS